MRAKDLASYDYKIRSLFDMKKVMRRNNNSAQKYVNILGINITSSSRTRVLARVNDLLPYNSLKSNSNAKFYIVTPNPELVLMAQDNKLLKNALNSADIAIPDGIGLAQAAKFLSLKTPKNIFLKFFVTFYQGLIVGFSTFFNKKYLTDHLETIKGREFFLDLIELLDKKGLKAFFLGGENGEARKAAQRLSEKYKKIKIEYFQGPMINNNAEPRSERDIELQSDAIYRINKFKPDMLFVAMSDPKEEIWVSRMHSQLNIKGAIALGGTFRFIAGMSKLPPVWLGDIGLEWVWRLITEPFRFRRILNAFPIFPIKVWMYKLQKN